MLLILDLDETLVYAATEELDRPADFRTGEYFVYRRPGVDRFLEFVRGQFDVAVWTSSGSEYGQEIVRNVFSDSRDLKFVWSRERCTHRIDQETREPIWMKDLKKVKNLGYPLEQILMVDDSPEKLERNYGNHIRVKPFEGSLEDEELVRLIQFLKKIADCPNVRSIDKRNWRLPQAGNLTSACT
jgi:TFIIF-interacting CTD phosphatase-like protein